MKTLEEQYPEFEKWAKEKYQFIHWGHHPLDAIKMWEEWKGGTSGKDKTF